MDPSIETMLYVFTGFMTVMSAVFTTLAVTTAGPAKAALSFYMSYGFELTGWYTEAQLSAMNLELGNVFYTFTTAKIMAGICIGVTLLLAAVYIGIEVYNYYHPEYTEMPRVIVEEVVTDEERYFVNYYCVRDQAGQLGDLNAWGAQRWNALYTTTDENAGDPIIASSLSVKLKDSTFPSEESGAVHYFGESAAANVNRYNFRKTAPATYIFFQRDHSLSMTASTFSGGQLIMFTGFGLLGGIALGSFSVIGAGKMKKKKDEAV